MIFIDRCDDCEYLLKNGRRVMLTAKPRLQNDILATLETHHSQKRRVLEVTQRFTLLRCQYILQFIMIIL